MSSDRVTAKDELLRIAAYFRRIGDLWEGPDGVGTHGTDLCQRIAQDAYSLAHERMALGLTAIPPIAAVRPEARADSAVPSSHGDSPKIEWPKEDHVQRRGDMGPEILRVTLDADNDVSLSVNLTDTVEFCNTGGNGGGRSPHTRAALINLMSAMERDAAAPTTASAPANSETDHPKAEGESILREALARLYDVVLKNNLATTGEVAEAMVAARSALAEILLNASGDETERSG